jgi:hypothetical protein
MQHGSLPRMASPLRRLLMCSRFGETAIVGCSGVRRIVVSVP